MKQKKYIYMQIVIVSIVSFTVLTGCFPGFGGQGQQKIKTNPVFSPDGKKIAFVANHDGDAEIFVVNKDGSGFKQLTFNKTTDANPNWSPEGKQIVFISDRSDDFEVYIMDADGNNQQLVPTDQLSDLSSN